MTRAFIFPFRLGFGCSGALAQSWHPPDAARRVLLGALEGGVRHFDTAPFYAEGEAERRLGAALAEFGGAAFVSTKTGTRFDALGRAAKDFSEAAIRRDVEGSLRRLRRERIDLLYLHGPSTDEEERGLAALARLKEEGKIALLGVCGEGEGLRRAASSAGVDVVMGVFNFLRREHAPIFRDAKANAKGVVAIAPLAQGLYDRRLYFPRDVAGIWRLARAIVKNRDALREARAARALLEGVRGMSPAQVALAFVHAEPAIDVALTSTTQPAHLAEILTGGKMTPPPAFNDALRSLTELGAAPS